MTVLFKKCTYGLLLVATTIIGLINFGYCADFFNIEYQSQRISANSSIDLNKGDCVTPATSTCSKNTKYYNSNGDLIGTTPNSAGYNLSCMDTTGYLVNKYGSNSCLYYIFRKVKSNFTYISTCPDCPTCPNQYTSLECQQQYDLIPVSSVDQNYCVNNNLCPSEGECPDIPIGTGGNWSALYINNIQYNGTPTIRVTIPEEIERDDYTDEEETNIEIIGYGYDQDKMQQMVNTQYYKPTAEEMSGLMGKIADFLPLIAVALLITRLRRVIKKVF